LNEDNISYEAMVKFEIGIDISSERITIPIRDSIGTLVGLKGRLLDNDKANGDKYMALYNFSKTRILYGLSTNEKDIAKAGEIIVLESEKQVVKLWGLGYKNCVAICGKSLSEVQIELILRCNVDIVLAFDKDVDELEISVSLEKLNFPVKTQRTFVLRDPLNLLAEKESPCDNADTWEVLYKNFKEEIV